MKSNQDDDEKSVNLGSIMTKSSTIKTKMTLGCLSQPNLFQNKLPGLQKLLPFPQTNLRLIKRKLCNAALCWATHETKDFIGSRRQICEDQQTKMLKPPCLEI